jgi:hypothetical protein
VKKKFARICEVCQHSWKSVSSYHYCVICPKCRVSGYHRGPREGDNGPK